MGILNALAWLFYDISIGLYRIGFWIVSTYNVKAKNRINGLKNQSYSFDTKEGQIVIHIHASSLGEYEQGRTLIKFIKEYDPDIFIALTFFSSSGYNNYKHEEKVNWVGYLPFDTKAGMSLFLEKLQPKLCIIIKNELWHNYIQLCHSKSIPLVFVFVVLRQGHYLFKPWAKTFLENMKKIRKIYLQDRKSVNLLKAKGISRVEYVGDGRIDRVTEINLNKATDQSGTRLFIAGSVWPKDLAVIQDTLHTMLEDWSVLIAPHEPTQKHVTQIKKVFPEAILFSQYQSLSWNDLLANHKVIILDTIGHLSSLYHMAHISYIGGGFGKSIHNILEPIAGLCPVIFGPNFKKFTEAIVIQEMKGGISISDEKEFKEAIRQFSHKEKHAQAVKACQKYISENVGASKRVLDDILTLKLLK